MSLLISLKNLSTAPVSLESLRATLCVEKFRVLE